MAVEALAWGCEAGASVAWEELFFGMGATGFMVK
jgi:hypothetical protein